jgi:hypothetical protein
MWRAFTIPAHRTAICPLVRVRYKPPKYSGQCADCSNMDVGDPDRKLLGGTHASEVGRIYLKAPAHLLKFSLPLVALP